MRRCSTHETDRLLRRYVNMMLCCCFISAKRKKGEYVILIFMSPEIVFAYKLTDTFIQSFYDIVTIN